MNSLNIKIKNIDHSSSYIYPTRTIEIKIGSKDTIYTPDRAATLSEYNHKINIPSEIPLDNKISLSFRSFNKEKLSQLLLENTQSYNNLFKNIKKSDEIMRYSPFRAHIMQPTSSVRYIINEDKKKIRVESGIEFLRNNQTLLSRFLRFILKIQIDLELPIVMIPFLGLSIDRYKAIANHVNLIKNNHREPFVILDLGYSTADKFSDLLKFFIVEQDIKLIGFYHKSFIVNALPYDIVSQYIEKNVVFVMLNVDRTDSVNYNISKMHYIPFLGNDIYALKTPVKFDDSSEEEAKTKENEMKGIKFFNPRNLTIELAENRISNYNQILKEMGQENNDKLEEIISDFDNIRNDRKKIDIMRSFSKVHEIKASSSEFVKFNKRINSNESKNYVEEKNYLKLSLSNLQMKRKIN